MSQHYSDPKRAHDRYALPDVETWRDVVLTSACCNVDAPMSLVSVALSDARCPSCGKSQRQWLGRRSGSKVRHGWFYQFCFPGCLPDSDPMGPFDTEAEALADAREGIDDDEFDESEA
jgi:hypothetical protein